MGRPLGDAARPLPDRSARARPPPDAPARDAAVSTISTPPWKARCRREIDAIGFRSVRNFPPAHRRLARPERSDRPRPDRYRREHVPHRRAVRACERIENESKPGRPRQNFKTRLFVKLARSAETTRRSDRGRASPAVRTLHVEEPGGSRPTLVISGSRLRRPTRRR